MKAKIVINLDFDKIEEDAHLSKHAIEREFKKIMEEQFPLTDSESEYDIKITMED